jgi:competence protein ComEA
MKTFYNIISILIFSLSTTLLLYLTINTNTAEENANNIYFQIHGQVINPGIYQTTKGTRLFEAINLAGGLKDDFILDLRNINLSGVIKDGQNIYISNDITNQESVFKDDSPIQELININIASLNELDLLPGVGPSTAQKIVDNRPYEAIEDLKKVPGIGDSKFNKLKDLITI